MAQAAAPSGSRSATAESRMPVVVLKYPAVRPFRAKNELEEPGTQDMGARPDPVQGPLPAEMAAAHGRDARLHHRGDRGIPLGRPRRGGVPLHGVAALAPAGALGGGRALLDA